METRESHACKMPWRRGKWKNRIYICNCNTGWTVKTRLVAEESEAPIVIRDWHRVDLTVSETPVYLHG